MTSLLSRLQSLTAPSREVDGEIALAFGWTYAKLLPGALEPCWRAPTGQIRPEPPLYTASIDAALPWEDIIGTSEQSRRPGQPVKWVAVHRMPKGRMSVSGMGHTEAIARRVAALVAKQEMEGKP